MGLAHDNEGFLTGPKVDIDAASYAKHLAILREIRADSAEMRSDLSLIRKHITKASLVPPPLVVPGRRTSAANDSRERLLGGRRAPQGRSDNPAAPTVSPAAPTVSPAAPLASPSPGAAPQSAPADLGSPAPVIARPRKSNGQFGAGDGPARGDGEDVSARKEKQASLDLSDAAGALRRSAGEMLAGTGQVDPSMAAAKEMKDIVSPALGLFKPLGRLFGRRSGKSDAEKAAQTAVPWYRRLWGELRSINKKSGKGNGMMGMLGLLGGLAGLAGLIVRMSGLGLIGKLLSSLLARAGLGAALGGLGGRRGGRAGTGGRRDRRGGAGGAGGRGGRGGGDRGDRPRGGLLGKLGKGALRKLPLIGALMAGGSALYSMFGGGGQTKKERFEGAGSGIGSIIGGAIGALGGPLGIAAGAMLGNIVGEKVGTWLSTVDWSAIGTTISDTWTATADWTRKAFDGAVGYVKDSWKSVSDLGTKVFSSVSDWFDEKLGKAKELASTAVAAVKNAAGDVVDKAKALGTAAVDKASAFGGAVADKARAAIETAKDAGNAVYDRAGEVRSSVVDAAKNTATRATGGIYKGGSNANQSALIAEMNAQGIKDPKEQAMFMAQMDHESGGFKTYEENLNYSAKGLRKTFGKYYKTDAEASTDARNPEAIANKVYGGRMGNVDPGDGYKYRGRGAIQLTGKDNYARAGKALGLDLVNNPDLAKDPVNAAKIAAWYWKDRKLGDAGRAGDVTTATKKINGGTNGLEDRKAKYEQYLAQASGGGLTKQTADQSMAPPPAAVTRAIATASAAPRIEPLVSPISVTSKPVNYAPPAPDLMKYAPKVAPALPTPIASSAKTAGATTRAEQPLSQNLADRQLAAVATGGIGMQQMRV